MRFRAAFFILIIMLVFVMLTTAVLAAGDDANGDGYHDGDAAKMRAFLEHDSAIMGVKNGQHLSPSYDPHDESSWSGITWNDASPKRITRIEAGDKLLAGDADFSGLGELLLLDVHLNEFTSINLSGCDKIDRLNCSNNLLSSLSVSTTDREIMLECIDNQLETIDLCIGMDDYHIYTEGQGTVGVSRFYFGEDMIDMRLYAAAEGSWTFAEWYLLEMFETHDSPYQLPQDDASERNQYYYKALFDEDGYNDRDIAKMRAFLEQESAMAGVRNGTQLNPDYDPDDVNTWTGVNWDTVDCKEIVGVHFPNSSLAGDFDISELSQLKTAQIEHNQIRSVISTGSALKALYCSDNLISEIEEGRYFEVLSCRDNYIEALDVYAGDKRLKITSQGNGYIETYFLIPLPSIGDPDINISAVPSGSTGFVCWLRDERFDTDIPNVRVPNDMIPNEYHAIFDSCVVTFDKNGGDTDAVPASLTVPTNGKTTAPETSPTYAGYTFGGWYEEKACENAWDFQVDEVSDNMTLYAKWDEVRVSSVTISSESATVEVGDTLALDAVVLPSDALRPEVTWASSNEGVATVDEHGVVTAIAQGNATITATADGQSDTCEVSVYVPVSSVTLSSTSETIKVGQTVELSATVLPADAVCSMIWTSSDETVATVNANGTVTAVGVGSAAITVMADDKSETCTVTVEAVPAVTISGVLLDDNGNPLAGYCVELHSTPRVVVTDAQGKYTFTDVEIEDHTLIVKNTGGETLGTFALNIETGNDFDWDADGSDIDVTVQSNTAMLGFEITVSDSGDVTIDDVEGIANPATGGGVTLWWAAVMTIIIAAAVASVRFFRKRKA